MNAHTSRRPVFVIFTLVLLIVQLACAGGSQAAPTEAAIVNTATEAFTSTPADTPTPKATSTRTPTPLPTATFTPNVTATQIPEITPAAEGKGNVIGLVVWNGEPVKQAAVWLCEKFEGACLGTYQYRANTDKNGYYVFENVTPGKYLVAINSFSTGWFIFYFDSDGSREQTVSAGKNLILDPLNLWKVDLKPVSPRYGKAISNAHPTFIWEPYKDAAYYQFSIYDDNFNVVLENKRVDGIEFILEDETLVTCNYYWAVEAYNAEGVPISRSKYGTSLFMYFINIDLPGTC